MVSVRSQFHAQNKGFRDRNRQVSSGSNGYTNRYSGGMMTDQTPTDEKDAHAEYIGSLCQTCASGEYVRTEQGVECGACAGVAGITGSLPPISYRA